MRRLRTLALLLSLAVGTSWGQARQAVIRISPFVNSGVSSSESSMLERLVASYVVELKAFRVVDAQGQEMALIETEAALTLGGAPTSALPLTADFILGGAIGKVGDIFIFTLENTRVSSGEKLTVSDTAHSISDIVLRARALTRSLFGKQEALGATAGAVPEGTPTIDPAAPAYAAKGPARVGEAVRTPELSDIVGSWKGDKGLETVRIFPNGTGLAVLSGGGTLKLRVAIRDGAIVITQDQPNDVALYKAASITLEMAKRIAAQARPMSWNFFLSEDGLSLHGTKASISISGTGPTVQVDNSYVREASWARISR